MNIKYSIRLFSTERENGYPRLYNIFTCAINIMKELTCLFIRWEEGAPVRSKQYDANRLLAPRCSFSLHPERKFCCYGDAALQSELTRIFYIAYCRPDPLWEASKMSFCPNVQSDEIKKFSLNRDGDADGSVSDRVQHPVSQVGLKRQLLRDLISVIYLCNVYFSSVDNMQMQWRYSERRAQSPCSHSLCPVGVVVIVLSWERKQTLNSVNQWQRERSQVTWFFPALSGGQTRV